MMRRFILIFMLLLCARDLRATVLVPADFSEIVTGSQIIVYGRVTSVHAEWSDDRRRIDTTVTVMAGSYLKGGPGGTVTFPIVGNLQASLCEHRFALYRHPGFGSRER